MRRARGSRWLRVLSGSLLAPLLLAACGRDRASTHATGASRPDVGVVGAIIDGDTIDVEIQGGTERVRLLGIDTPEIEHDREAGECYGNEATENTRRLLPVGTRVRLERDVVGRDDYGRLLAYVFDEQDGRLLNEQIVADGFATPLIIEPNVAYRRRIVEAAGAAQAGQIGL